MTCCTMELHFIYSSAVSCTTEPLSLFWNRSYHTRSFLVLVQYSPMSREREREMFHLTMHSTHFIYGYMASDIWLRTILIVRKETRCCHIGYSFRLTARVLLYAPSHRQDSTYHGLCYTSLGALAGTRNTHEQMLYHEQCCISAQAKKAQA